MTTFSLAVEAQFVADPPTTDDDFEAFIEQTLEELDKLAYEVDVACSLRDRTAEFAWAGERPGFEEAVHDFLVALRTALHAAGCATPGWPPFEIIYQTIRHLQGADARGSRLQHA